MWRSSYQIVPADVKRPDRCEDRAAVIPCAWGMALVVCDGAGGIGGGADAADQVLKALTSLFNASPLRPPVAVIQHEIFNLDDSLVSRSGGESTVVAALLDDSKLTAIGAGDSELMVMNGNHGWSTPIQNQSRKRVGSGECRPSAIELPLTYCRRVMLGSDGIFKYVPRQRLTEILDAAADLKHICDSLVDAARLPSGAYWDDISVIVAENC